MTEILSSFAAVIVAFLPLSLKREISLYLPLVLGFGALLLLFGSVPFLMGLLRRERFLAGLFSTVSPTGGPKAHLIGPYRVVSTIGAGGMGTVFKGLDSQGRAVAIKMIGGSQLKGTVLLQAKKNAHFRISLVREAKLAANLRHPNIVRIYDIGQHKGALYVAMELLDGMPLDRYAKTHAISAPEALRIVAQLCDALDCAHSHRIIHRDIKPANMFMTASGVVKVLDFGIALLPDESHSLGMVAGTPEYMSPEQILGQEVDGRSDIWSAGVTLYQLLTTTSPFRARSIAELRDKILSSPTPKLPFVGEFAEELNSILRKALAKHRSERYGSARELASNLRLIMLKINKNEIAAESAQSPLGAPAQTEDGAAARAIYQPVTLGFQAQVKTPAVILPFPVSNQKVAPLPIKILSELFTTALFAGAITIFGGRFLDLILDLGRRAPIGIGKVTFFLSFILLSYARFGEFRSRRRIVGCRSCGRRMRRVSKWSRPTWLSEQDGFCVPDCVAALKSDMWEEAVKLLFVHTSNEKSEREYNLEFLECASCNDQKAHLTLRISDDGSWELRGLCEAYRFSTPEKAQQYLSETKPMRPASSSYSEEVPSATAVLQKKSDIYDGPTM